MMVPRLVILPIIRLVHRCCHPKSSLQLCSLLAIILSGGRSVLN